MAENERSLIRELDHLAYLLYRPRFTWSKSVTLLIYLFLFKINYLLSKHFGRFGRWWPPVHSRPPLTTPNHAGFPSNWIGEVPIKRNRHLWGRGGPQMSFYTYFFFSCMTVSKNTVFLVQLILLSPYNVKIMSSISRVGLILPLLSLLILPFFRSMYPPLYNQKTQIWNFYSDGSNEYYHHLY